MSNNILVIESLSSSISEQLKCLKLEYNNQSKDEDIHSWLIKNSDSFKSIEKIIIPCRLGSEDAEFMGLYIGLHIRLTKELAQARFIPIAFLSDSSKEDILSNQIEKNKIKSALLLFTPGSYLMSSFDLEEFVNRKLSPIDDEILLKNVIPNLNIENTKDTGHQLANEWGAFRLAKYAGYTLKQEKPFSLFFKYKDSFTNNETIPNPNTIVGLFSESCKALLIDDNANSGWSETLKYILRSKIVNPAKLVSLDVVDTFEKANAMTNYEDYDVVFLDLRLYKEEDKLNHVMNIDEFSGTKILNRIMDINRGIQVIIFTASNKIWNIEKLLELGANGYYIKESPEYVLNSDFSKDNYDEFLKTIKKCLSLKFLKKVDILHKTCANFILSDSPSKNVDYKQFYERTTAAFEISYDLLEKTTKDSKYFNFAFLTYFQILEDYVSLNENFTYISQQECYAGTPRVRVIYESSGDIVWKLTHKSDSVTGGYFEINDEIKTINFSVQTLSKVSFVLAFKFSKDNAFLRKWGRLNHIRNTKAGHGGSGGYVAFSDIQELFEIVELFLTNP